MEVAAAPSGHRPAIRRRPPLECLVQQRSFAGPELRWPPGAWGVRQARPAPLKVPITPGADAVRRRPQQPRHTQHRLPLRHQQHRLRPTAHPRLRGRLHQAPPIANRLRQAMRHTASPPASPFLWSTTFVKLLSRAPPRRRARGTAWSPACTSCSAAAVPWSPNPTVRRRSVTGRRCLSRARSTWPRRSSAPSSRCLAPAPTP